MLGFIFLSITVFCFVLAICCIMSVNFYEDSNPGAFFFAISMALGAIIYLNYSTVISAEKRIKANQITLKLYQDQLSELESDIGKVNKFEQSSYTANGDTPYSTSLIEVSELRSYISDKKSKIIFDFQHLIEKRENGIFWFTVSKGYKHINLMECKHECSVPR